MQIELPQDEHNKLTLLATEAGYDSVERFVVEHLRMLAQYPAVADLVPLSEEQLQQSLAMCDRGMAEMDAGEGVDARKALQELGRKRDFSLDG